MTFEFDEKNKIYTDVITKVPIPALIQTTKHLIRGNVHTRPNERLKDEFDRDEPFLAMTDVSVFGADDQVLYQSDFLAVRRTHIVWVMPQEERGEQDNND